MILGVHNKFVLCISDNFNLQYARNSSFIDEFLIKTARTPIWISVDCQKVKIEAGGSLLKIEKIAISPQKIH